MASNTYLFLFLVAMMSVSVRAQSFDWTFPIVGVNNWTFANFDTVLVSWTPATTVITEIFLNCSDNSGSNVFGHETATGIQFERVSSPAIYNVNWVAREANDTFCIFCAGNLGEQCTGAFHLVDNTTGVAPTTWSLANFLNISGSNSSSISNGTIYSNSTRTSSVAKASVGVQSTVTASYLAGTTTLSVGYTTTATASYIKETVTSSVSLSSSSTSKNSSGTSTATAVKATQTANRGMGREGYRYADSAMVVAGVVVFVVWGRDY